MNVVGVLPRHFDIPTIRHTDFGKLGNASVLKSTTCFAGFIEEDAIIARLVFYKPTTPEMEVDLTHTVQIAFGNGTGEPLLPVISGLKDIHTYIGEQLLPRFEPFS
ncbi:MAG: hypothetical protein ACR2GU_16435 [Rubrobacteraceae bacterium]